MTLHTQKYLRLIIPGILLYGLLVVFCWTTDWCSLPIPAAWDEITKLLAAVVLGVIYHYTGLRELSNGFYHLAVNRSIVEKLTAPFANAIPNINTMTWQKFRPIFYYFVDHDQSLKVQSDIIRFNGLLWTSIADLRVVAIIAIILFASSIVCSEFLPLPGFPAYRAAIPIVLLTIVFLLTFW